MLKTILQATAMTRASKPKGTKMGASLKIQYENAVKCTRTLVHKGFDIK